MIRWFAVLAMIFASCDKASITLGRKPSAPSSSSQSATPNQGPPSNPTNQEAPPPVIPQVPQNAPSCLLSATPNSLPSGGGPSRIIMSTFGDPTSATLDGFSIPPAGGSLTEILMATRKIIGTVSNSAGAGNCSVEVAVSPNPISPPGCQLKASLSVVQTGGTSELFLTVSGDVTSVQLNGMTFPLTGGSLTVHPITTTSYEGLVVGPGGSTTCTTTVAVVPI